MTTEGLTPEQLAFFHENGYLVLPNHLTPEEVQRCLVETNHLLDTFPLDTHPLTQFTTGDDEPSTGDGASNKEHVGDDYFLTSGDKIRFFFEPDAFSPDAPGTLLKPKQQAVNKIGHSLHSLSAPFKEVSLTARNAAIARSLGFQDPRVLQSMVICKQPSIGGAVPSHQDSTFLYTDPPSAVGWWFALQDATTENGTLGMVPGSHRTHKIQKRFVRRVPDGSKGTEFVDNTGAKMPRGMVEAEASETEGVEVQLLDIPAGSLVLIHGNVLHQSSKNTGPKSRFAYTFHVIEGADGWNYDERNWLQPPENGEGFTKLYQEHH
ncbi:phytanoyl-CoA dioxygenase family protein [Aspergillus saccharolyticus JOP 1030-1]|uniref:Phytanoyl-CoA dioxygenase n=1 Tax=Aspergillus saccharolyticus JOP 1030-1 TaxID=1450539 RepID=A0A318ZMZ1_9EURO|nr:phytanoyl-CoA dioxygenase [Aspergillus saccharolyticus JOP 1030-1]PYH48981.1 phytanoyl-CoA dioxygenase [Aspergillus saccharolyticus JOP 1030-1]